MRGEEAGALRGAGFGIRKLGLGSLRFALLAEGFRSLLILGGFAFNLDCGSHGCCRCGDWFQNLDLKSLSPLAILILGID